MKCKKFKEKIILYLYGELTAKEKQELESHIEKCPRCAEDFSYTREVFQAVDDSGKKRIPEADWEKCWKEIDEGLQEQPLKRRSFVSLPQFPQWAYAATALIAVFAIGILIGRLWFFPGQQPAMEPTLSQSALNPTLQEHFEDLKPVLVEYANYTSPAEGNGTIVMNKELVHSLLLQNILLKRMLAKKDPSLLPLLEDLDLVLKEIANHKREDRRTPSLIKDLIHQRDILFKMEILQKM